MLPRLKIAVMYFSMNEQYMIANFFKIFLIDIALHQAKIQMNRIASRFIAAKVTLGAFPFLGLILQFWAINHL